MQEQNYQCIFDAPATPMDAQEAIADVSGWWAKVCEGSTRQLHDRFTVRFGPTFVDFEVTELVPGRKTVWAVRDCFLHWINDKHEWNGNRIVWELEPTASGTHVKMTHIGLTPHSECYADCKPGWNEHAGHSLKNYMTEHVGMPI